MSVNEFLKQRAVNIVVGGTYMLPRWLDPQGKPRSFACRTSRVSPFRMMVDAPVTGTQNSLVSPQDPATAAAHRCRQPRC